MGSKRFGWSNKIIGVLLLLLFAVVVAQAAYASFFDPRAVVHLAGARFEVTIADTEKTRTQGLSGTSNLPADQAMLFIFDYDRKWSIWMKDMNYPIDIVWLNQKREVIDYVTNVPPASYPDKTFSPKENARYVLEFQSGVVKKKGIKQGQIAVFSGTDKKL